MKNLAAVSHTYLELVKGLFNTTVINNVSEGTNSASVNPPKMSDNTSEFIESFEKANSDYNKTMFANVTYN